MDTINFFLKH